MNKQIKALQQAVIIKANEAIEHNQDCADDLLMAMLQVEHNGDHVFFALYDLQSAIEFCEGIGQDTIFLAFFDGMQWVDHDSFLTCVNSEQWEL